MVTYRGDNNNGCMGDSNIHTMTNMQRVTMTQIMTHAKTMTNIQRVTMTQIMIHTKTTKMQRVTMTHTKTMTKMQG